MPRAGLLRRTACLVAGAGSLEKRVGYATRTGIGENSTAESKGDRGDRLSAATHSLSFRLKHQPHFQEPVYRALPVTPLPLSMKRTNVPRLTGRTWT